MSPSTQTSRNNIDPELAHHHSPQKLFADWQQPRNSRYDSTTSSTTSGFISGFKTFNKKKLKYYFYYVLNYYDLYKVFVESYLFIGGGEPLTLNEKLHLSARSSGASELQNSSRASFSDSTNTWWQDQNSSSLQHHFTKFNENERFDFNFFNFLYKKSFLFKLFVKSYFRNISKNIQQYQKGYDSLSKLNNSLPAKPSQPTQKAIRMDIDLSQPIAAKEVTEQKLPAKGFIYHF